LLLLLLLPPLLLLLLLLPMKSFTILLLVIESCEMCWKERRYVAQDYAEAVRLYRLAAAQGHAAAAAALRWYA
jgi:hypothetical protein